MIIFFVLSGYLVGGSVLSSKMAGFWPRYSVQRLSRLWIVLLPCLAATLFWNFLGRHTGGDLYLSGGLNPPLGSAPSGHVHLDPPTFFGNIFFLQTIVTPILGDNGPLWSLANEFWYYAIFPMLFFGLRKSEEMSATFRILLLLLAAAILLLLPRGMQLGFVVWLFGAAISAATELRFYRFTRSLSFGILSLVTCLVLFHKSREGVSADVFLGLSFAATLPSLMSLRISPGWLVSISAWLSDFSYTLYLAHFPLVAFIWYTFFDAHRLNPSFTAAMRFFVISLVLLIYAFLMSLAFERNTESFRRYIMTWVSKMKHPAFLKAA